MRILFVSALLPYPLHSGGQVRLYNLLSRVSKDNEISLFTFLRTEDERLLLRNLHFCKNIETVMRGKARQLKYIIASVFGANSLLFASYDLLEMRQKIADALLLAEKIGKPFDIVHIEPSYVGKSLPPLQIPLVVAEHNIEYKVYELYAAHSRWHRLLDWDVSKLRESEEEMWELADSLITVREKDKKTIEEVIKNKSVHVVRNGVDIQEFTYKPKKIPQRFVCLYIGNFAWIQNMRAVSYLLDTIWPVIKKEFPASSLRIVGAKMPERIKSKAALLDGVKIIGTTNDIVGEYHNAHILLAPIEVGGGTKYKILEAMASGTPVITSEIGAEGIDRSLLHIAHEPKDYIFEIKRLQNNTDLEQKLASARKHIEKNYTWDIISASLANAWRQLYESTH